MGRLEDIVDRNQHPRKYRKMPVSVGILLSAFVLLVLVLMIFTDLALSPSDEVAPPAQGSASAEKHVDGVLLYRVPRARDAGLDAR